MIPMGFIKPITSYYPSSSKQNLLILSIIFISFPVFLLIVSSIFSCPRLIDVIRLQTTQSSTYFPSTNRIKPPGWLKALWRAHSKYHRILKVGLINFKGGEQYLLLPAVEGIAQYISIDLEPVSSNVTWKNLFPEWINETPSDKCPKLPMAKPMKYIGLDVLVVKLPCGENSGNNKSREEGIRDVHRLQVSLASVRVTVENSMDKSGDVYVVFISKCEPMVEIFKCDDLIWHGGLYWVYKPNVEKLKEILSMPIGACQLARPYIGATLGTSQLQENFKATSKLQTKFPIKSNMNRKVAYVTVLHSSEIYVCGAIALARSILQTNTTKDLVLLADPTISDHSIKGLKAAGWIIKRIKRIRSPNANPNAYNKWNYSKLRVWQLTNYDKVMFIDSDFIVLKNIDHFFEYPQISAGPNDQWLFNSGIMIVEPSECFFKYLMRRRYTLKSYNGGDQGYLNEAVTWWHRLTKKLNFMKFYSYEGGNRSRSVPTDRYTIHYLGIKPWLCYRDYDCNWDKEDTHKFASDELHARWWKVYDDMPNKLQKYCGLTKQLNHVLLTTRVKARC